MMGEFSGRVAMITGAAGNLGQAIASRLHEAGARTVLADRNAEKLTAVFASLADHPDHQLAAGADVMAPKALDDIVAKATGRFGRLDVLVNAVGGFRAGHPVHETPLETWDLMLDLNLRSSLLAARAVLPTMLRQGDGKIVLVAARAALGGAANLAAYSAAKAAVVRLTESMAAEVRHAGINVNCVLPGTLDTPQNRANRPDADFTKWVPLAAVADVIAFLASERASAVHGAAVPVYGLS
jgi:NAD(P)-dependent dehydrogenase (short-subunit alcohol dehydrogenase family)